MENDVEVVTILTMRLPREFSGAVKRRTKVDGDTAIQVMRLLEASLTVDIVISPEDAPTDLASAVEFDISEILGSIPPNCPICEEPFDGPHSACENKVLNYLRVS